MSNWHSYIAGFFDGEGSVTITRQKAGPHSDYHKVIVTLCQKVEHMAVLETIQREFGGTILIRRQSTRVSHKWSDTAYWQLQKRSDIARFLETIGPMLIVKATPAWIAREFLASVTPKRTSKRSFADRELDEDELALRDGFMLAIQEANRLGPRERASTSIRAMVFPRTSAVREGV